MRTRAAGRALSLRRPAGRAPRRAPVLFGLGAALAGALGPASATGQVRLQDLVVTMGMSADWHHGNFSAVTVPRLDSAESVASAAGLAQLRTGVLLFSGERRGLLVEFDGSLQQFATSGFEYRSYAPRMHSGDLTASYREQLGSGVLGLSAQAATMGVNDPPPLPLYLPPGYRTFSGAATYNRAVGGISALVGVSAEDANYAAILPQLDLLDRSALRTWVRAAPWAWGRSRLDLLGEYSYLSYTRQGGSGAPNDPFRTDHMFRAGATWQFQDEDRGLEVAFTMDGTLNRSNSARVEYDLLRLSATAETWLGSNVLFLDGRFTAKRYLQPFMHALVPGEEADNDSYVAASLSRALGQGLRGSVRVRWTRAETSFGGAYFRRLGASFSLNYRPPL